MKRALCLAGLLAWGLLAVTSYRSSRLVAFAERLENPETKIRLLRSAEAGALPEPSAPYSLGKAYHDLGLRKYAAGAKGEEELRLSVAALRRSIRRNPFSAFSHFQLARALMDLDAISGIQEDPLEEFKRAAKLSGFNSQIYFEVGKALLARWKTLEPDNREFARGILKSVLAVRDTALALGIFEVWGMDEPDYALMKSILPENAGIERAYADFLGRKSLSYPERLAWLVQSEARVFRDAVKEFERGERELSSARFDNAVDTYWQCMKMLRGIRFYQDLAASRSIDPAAYRDLQRACWLKLTRSAIEAGLELRVIRRYLLEYLGMEDRVSELAPLEAFLRERGLIDDRTFKNLDDPGKTGMALALFFKENRYQDIIQSGRLFERNFGSIPSDKREEYARLLLVLGDAYDKLDYLYDAGDAYRKASEIRPRDLNILVRLRQNAVRLNDERALAEVNARIQESMTAREIVVGPTPILMGSVFSRALVLDGRRCILSFRFAEFGQGRPPLVSVLFNGRAVYEGYLADRTFSVAVDTAVGANEISVACLNREAGLEQLTYQ